jgi:hypothetical protein
VNATIIGGLVGGILVFLSSILVPVVTKRLNKATDAAASAEKLGNTAVNLATVLEKRVFQAEQQCEDCLGELDKMKHRALKRDRSLDAVHAALLEIVPLLDADAQATEMLRAAIRTLARTRYDEE